MLRRFWHSNQGVAAIEMAFAFPLVLWFVIGILEVAIIFHISSLMNFATVEAARKGKTGNGYGHVGGSRGLIQEIITNKMGPWTRVEDGESSLTITYKSWGSFDQLGQPGTDGFGSRGHIVIYTPVLHWRYLTPFFGAMMGSPTQDIAGRVLMVSEQNPERF